MKSLIQLEIPKRSSHCFQRGEHLLPGMEIYSLILEDDSRHLLRRDYCANCWKGADSAQEGVNAEPRGYWKSTIIRKNKMDEPSRTVRALNLLRELLSSPTGREEEIFILCLFLSHARQLALRHEFREDGIDYQLYEILKKEEFITIKAFYLSQTQIEAIQKSLAHHLNDSPMPHAK